MSDKLYELEVSIKGNVSKLTQSAREAIQSTKRMVGSINSEVDKIKSPAESINNDRTMQQIRRTNQLIKKSFSDLVPTGTIDKIRNYTKEAQLAAGIKVYTEDYQNLERDIAGTEKELSKLEEKLRNMDESKRFVPTQEFKDLEKNIQNNQSALDKMLEKKRKMEESGKATTPTEEGDAITGHIADAEKRLSGLIAKQKEWQELGVGNGSLAMKNLTNDIGKAEKEVEYLKGKLKDLKESGGAGKPTQEFKELINEISRTEKKLAEYQEQRSQMLLDGSNLEETEAFRRIEMAIADARRELSDYNAEKRSMVASGKDVQFSGGLASRSIGATAGAVKDYGMSQAAEKIRQVNAAVTEAVSKIPIVGRVASEAAFIGSKAFGGLRAVLGKVTSGIKNSGGAFSSLIQRFKTGIPHLNKARSSMNRLGNTGHGLGGILKTVAISAKFMFASFLIRGAIDSAKQGMQNLAQYSAETNNSLSMLKSSLTQVQNSLATAFAPVLNAVAPVLNTLVDLLVTATTAIGHFFAALTGQKTYTVAKKVQQDYAASLGGTADAANGANAAAKELQRTIMGFDEINKLDDDSGSGGSGGSGSGGSGLSASDMFTTETVSNPYSDFAQKIKEAWAESDFTEIGNIIGKKLQDALDSIPWDGIKQSAKNIGKDIATLINGFVETSGLADSVGNTVAQLINTGVSGANSFLTDLRWENVGKFVADTMNGFIKNADWNGAGDAIATGINGVVKLASTWSDKFNFDKLGSSIAKFINSALNGITWSEVLTATARIGRGIANGINKFLGESDWDQIGVSVSGCLNTLFNLANTWSGKFDFEKLGSAVSKAVNSALKSVEWKDAITAAENIGKGIATSLNSFITKDTFSNIGSTVANAVNTVVSGAYSLIGTIDWKQWGASIAVGIDEFFADFDFEKAGLTFSDGVNGILDAILSALNTADGNGTWEKIGGDIGDFIAGLKWEEHLSKVGTIIWKTIKGAITSALEIAKSDPDLIVDLGALLIFKFITKSVFNTTASTIVSGISAALGMLTPVALSPLGISVASIIALGISAIGPEGIAEAINAETISDGIAIALDNAQENTKKSFQEFSRQFHQNLADELNNEDNFTNSHTIFNGGTYSGAGKTFSVETEINVTGFNIPENLKSIDGFKAAVQHIKEQNVPLAEKQSPGWTSLITTPIDKISTDKKTINGMTGYVNKTGTQKGKKLTLADITAYSKKVGWDKNPNKMLQISALAKKVGWDSNPNKKVSVSAITEKIKWSENSDKKLSVSTETKKVGWASGANKNKDVTTTTSKVEWNSGADRIKEVIARTGTIGWSYGADQTLSGVKAKANSIVKDANFQGISLSGSLTSVVAGGLRMLLKKSGGIFTGSTWRPVTAAASGGSFSMGQMFIAREAGPELVGTIGGNTAVMNNNQIVSSVSAGVYQAVVAAMSHMSRGSNQQVNVRVILEGDAKGIFRVVKQENDRIVLSTGEPALLT